MSRSPKEYLQHILEESSFMIENSQGMDIAILHRARHEADSTSPSEQGFRIFTCTSLESEWL